MAEAKTKEEARAIHRKLWNLGNAPFLIILLPNEIRVYTGFDFSQRNERQGLIKEIKEIVSLTFENICDRLADFKADSIDSGILWKTQATNLTPERRVDTHLLNNLRILEEYLEGTGLDLPVAHALIGKYVYIRYLRDRGILSTEWLEENEIDLDTVLGRNATLAGLLRLTEALEERFNGAIFPLPPGAEENMNDTVVSLVASTFKGDDLRSGQLHLDFEPYDFSYIPVETLSSIYEQFLRKQGTGKKVGAVYTPEPLADYLLCELEQSKPLRRGMQILDPCCGSGIFLVLAYRRLVELELSQSSNRELKPTKLRQILCESLYGVERNKDACYVAEFSLILTLLNYVEPPDLHKNKHFKFPRLHNTQIFECDFFDNESLFWKENKQFDWIIGNPPWIELKPNTEGEDLVRAWINKNIQEKSTTGNRVSEAFSWRVTDLLAPEGYVGLLIHAKSLFNYESEKYRKSFFKQHEVARVTNFSNLAYVLFNGRGEAPAATIIYRKANLDKDKPYIVHYSPFVANQISNRPWEPDKKNGTWTITINESEIQAVSPEEAEIGKAITWKLALWGSHRDQKAIKRLGRLFSNTLGKLAEEKNWHIHQGIELRDSLNTNEVEYAPYLKDWKCLDTNIVIRSGRHFSLPEDALKMIPPEKHYIRKRGGKIGLNVGYAPHLILTPNYCIYSAENFIIPTRKVGIAGNQVDAEYLQALSVFLSSSISKYYLFFQSPSWGVDRIVISTKDVNSIPVPRLSPAQISELAELQRQLATLENIGSYSELSLQEQIDEEIQQILRIPKNLSILAKDFMNFRLQLNKGKAVIPATEPPEVNHLYDYGLCLRDELDAFTEGSGMHHKIFLVYSRDLIVCSLEFVGSDDSLDICVEAARGDWLSFLSYVKEKLRQRFSQWVYVQRSLRIFDNSRIYICKTPRLIDWTKTQALNDSDDIIAEIISAKRETYEVAR